MKAIFLCQNTQNIFKVYSDDTVSKLQRSLEIERKIYSRSDILEAPESFSDVELIFSTWGMPQFSEEEIKAFLPSLKCVFYGAGTVQNFARPFLASGVKVFSAWAANAVPVAEMTVAQMILANKGYFLASRLYHEKGRDTAQEEFAK